VGRLHRTIAIASTLAATACTGSGAQPHTAAPERPPVGAVVEPWGWIGIRGGHVELRYHDTSWASAGPFRRPPEWVSSAAVSRSHIAFAVEGRGLFVATIPGSERHIAGAAAEHPVTWAPAGDLLTLDRGGHVVARSATGSVLRKWRVKGGAEAVERSGGLLYLNRSGELMRIDGARALPLVNAARVVGDARTVEALADGSIAVLGTRSLGIFSPTGVLTASTGAQSRIMNVQALRAAPDGRGYAYVSTLHGVKGGIDRIELLVPGARAPRTLATVRVSLEGCGWGSDVRWDGSWVHYRNADGRRVAVNAAA